ncbi:hypothetical protein SAV14893_096690 [Streptomyces avermitilis]|uniref:Uncharacterized protein n=2 Tax=Streptomyces avermitilis TaxID=33903 RepID=A0A143SZS1_STRAW|nr:hypothetical protein SAVERM_2p165 [Streptomyces avermitilis MA-4680 = NBRC 14893]GDY70276.1 hypothetical protein SAV14893_096690 [Streptomyces avermitilis]GDY80584.1 hypothetical protein SAV31267_100690 [Streptomyces avermitilis]
MGERTACIGFRLGPAVERAVESAVDDVRAGQYDGGVGAERTDGSGRSVVAVIRDGRGWRLFLRALSPGAVT